MNSKINTRFIEDWIDDFIYEEYNIYPKEYFKKYNMSYEEFKHQVIFEIYIQKYRIEESEEKSLKKGIKNHSISAEQKRKRTFEKVRIERETTFNRIKEYSGIEIPELIIKKQTSINEKKKGYKLVDFQHYQLSVMEDYELLKNIENKKIYTSKNLTNTKFKYLFSEYDGFYKRLEDDFENYFERAMHIFLLEKKFCIEFMYDITKLILEKKYKLEDIDNVIPLIRINIFNIPIQENPFILCRQKYIDALSRNISIGEIYDEIIEVYAMKNNIKKFFQMYIPLITSYKDEEQYFKDNYKIEQIINIKEWDNNSIHIFKKVVSNLVK